MASSGPPPVPGPPLPRPQPFPSGQRRRRRRRRRLPHLLATLALLIAPVGVAAAAYLAFASEQDSRGSALPFALDAPPARDAPQATPPARPREPAPLVQGEPVPAIPLSGVD